MIEGGESIWQDREIRFDAKPAQLACRKGEKIIDSINSVEDTKGNNGGRGSLLVTNLRIIWVAHTNNNVNLSIGLNAIVTVNIRKAKSKLRGHTQALCVLAKFNSRFEFIFTSLVKNSPRLFTTVQSVMRAYETSKLYRDLKLRGSIIRDGELIILPGEEIFNKVGGVWNLSSDQKSIRIRDSKFGRALVLETYARAGGYILGFRIDPPDLLEMATKEILNLHKVFSVNPNFGVDFSVESEAPSIQQLLQPRVEEDTDIVEDREDSHAVAAYFADAVDAGDDDARFDSVQYDSRLGLAIENLQEGLTLEQLWRVV